MLKLEIKNKDLYFVIETIWNILDYRFKYQINQLVSINSADNYIQEIDVDLDTLRECYLAISNKGYGYTCNMADDLIDDLRNQIIQNMDPNDPDNEYTKAGMLFQDLKDKDDETYENKCISGKEQILS